MPPYTSKKKYMKCRCGSDDRIIFTNGKLMRVADDKPHVCLDVQDMAAALQQANAGLQQHIEYLESQSGIISKIR